MLVKREVKYLESKLKQLILLFNYWILLSYIILLLIEQKFHNKLIKFLPLE